MTQRLADNAFYSEATPDRGLDKTEKNIEALYLSQDRPSTKEMSTLLERLDDPSGGLPSDAIRKINRLVTSLAPEAERQKILQERNELVRRQFKGGISEREEKRLEFLRWQLDRFDDADRGEALDRLEIITQTHEKFAKELTSFLDQVNTTLKAQSKPRKGKRR
jgi:hypothetical protein